ncbi:MAG: DUF1127 domain-containing protein [Pseudomonadota bacterium]
MTCAVSAGQSGASFLAWIRSSIAKLRRRRAERKAAAELLSLNDHLLHDIGIGRCEIERAVRYLGDNQVNCLRRKR